MQQDLLTRLSAEREHVGAVRHDTGDMKVKGTR